MKAYPTVLILLALAHPSLAQELARPLILKARAASAGSKLPGNSKPLISPEIPSESTTGNPAATSGNPSTTLLYTSGDTGEKTIHLHVLKGVATVNLSFTGDKKTVNRITVAEGASVVLQAFVVSVENAGTEELVSFYQFLPLAGGAQGGAQGGTQQGEAGGGTRRGAGAGVAEEAAN